MRTRIALHNLGCKVNACELDEIAALLPEEGFVPVDFHERADVYVVNTCTVTNIADRKTRQMLHRARRQNPEALIVALGCYVDVGGTDDCIDIALGNRDKKSLLQVLKSYGQEAPSPAGSAEASPCALPAFSPSARGGERLKSLSPEEAVPQGGFRFRTRAYLKIQDGCNLFCSYCIIPYARGRSVSVPREKVLDDLKQLAANGVREVVLTGIHLSSYGRDLGEDEAAAARLVLQAEETEGIERIRLGSLEPELMTEEVVRLLARSKKLCPHFHLSLQSGSDSVLRRMRRRYTTAEYARAVHLLRESFENPALTTDLIAGFPGETKEEFEAGRRFVDEMDFYETHVFPYSLRKGTAAAGMEGQLTAAEKAKRTASLLALSAEHARRYRASFLHRAERVLYEEEARIAGARFLVGHTARYVRIARRLTDAGAEEAEGNAAPGSFETLTPVRFWTEDTLLGA